MAKLLYGSGLRLMECLCLRVKDVDVAQTQVVVRDGKGGKDRVTVLPETLVPFLQEHLQHVEYLHDDDLRRGYGKIPLPDALARKYPHASREWIWQYVFPASQRRPHPRTGEIVRDHIQGFQTRHPPCRYQEARHAPRLPPLLRHAPA